MIAPNSPSSPSSVAPRLASPLVVVIPGEPKAQGRGRAVRFGSSVRVIDPESSRSWKGAAQVHMLAARQAAGVHAPLDVALVVTVDAFFKRPQMPKRAGTFALPKLSRPDADNLGKSVLDAGNSTLWTDDARVVELVVRKWFHAEGESPRVEVRVEEWAKTALAGERSSQ